jgi:hypothetical protein
LERIEIFEDSEGVGYGWRTLRSSKEVDHCARHTGDKRWRTESSAKAAAIIARDYVISGYYFA